MPISESQPDRAWNYCTIAEVTGRNGSQAAARETGERNRKTNDMAKTKNLLGRNLWSETVWPWG